VQCYVDSHKPSKACLATYVTPVYLAGMIPLAFLQAGLVMAFGGEFR
jgi:hypothetical protein